MIRFKAATWNVFHGTDVEDLEPILTRLIKQGVTVFLLQEAAGRDIAGMLRRAGLDYEAYGQHLIAWDRYTWRAKSYDQLKLGETHYYRKDGKTPIWSEAVAVVLVHRQTGKVLDTMSYHTPAHVQVKPGRRPKRRFRALVESMRTMRRRAAARVHALYGGDDNVDEFRAFRGTWRFMLKVGTGLRQVRAPRPTHGHRRRGRKIDDFRVKGLAVGDGQVLEGGGDHRVHVREFGFRR